MQTDLDHGLNEMPKKSQKNFKKDITHLENEIIRHKVLYYKGDPLITDTEYDALEEELKELSPDSYVLKMVGSNAQMSLKKVAHKTKMLSLAKTYDVNDLKKWIGEYEVVATHKIDGVSCSLIYENNKLVMAKTRGNGSLGEDISVHIKWIPDIPKSIEYKELSSFEVRGELYCHQDNFQKLSEEMFELGLERPTSMRNIVAGLVGRKDSLELLRYINFFSFSLLPLTDDFFNDELQTEWDKIQMLSKLGFNNPYCQLLKETSSVEKEIEYLKESIEKGKILIDGLVFTINDLKVHEELGETAHHPRYKMAFKLLGEEKETEIEEIIWSVSRNGVLTPVANVKPVVLSGAKISRVTLHNFGMVKEHQLKKGDMIRITRSGEVIPKFLSVVKSSANSFHFPKECPTCHQEVVENDIRLICTNDQCAGREKENILYFIRKMEMADLSSKRLEGFIEANLVSKIPDLFDIKREDLLNLEKIKDKLANKIIMSIQNSIQDADLVRFLTALGITGGASNKIAKIIDSGVDSLDKFLKLTIEELMKVDSFAEKSATEFIHSFQSKKELIKELKSKGLTIKKIVVDSSNKKLLNGQKFCITGTLSMKRSDIEKMIKENGGQVVGSVSTKTHYLLTNDTDSSSSKFKKAQKLNIPIINEEKFLKLIKS